MLKYRKTNSLDRTQIQQWIALDPDHKDKTDAEFWIEEKPGIENFAIADEVGTVFYVRAENLLRLHIQFAPNQKTRTACAIDQFAGIISESAAKRNYKQIIFESVFEPLIAFLEKRGFRKSPNECVRDL